MTRQQDRAVQVVCPADELRLEGCNRAVDLVPFFD